jgi:hypothetical protein
MIVDPASRDWRDKKVREWQLLLLRFAITREPADQIAVLALAEELDSVGVWWRPAGPSFFRRTSQEVCAAIQAAGAPQQTALLQEYISRIADPRLRRAFASAVSLQQPGPQRPSLKRAKRKESDLWKGLARK